MRRGPISTAETEHNSQRHCDELNENNIGGQQNKKLAIFNRIRAHLHVYVRARIAARKQDYLRNINTIDGVYGMFTIHVYSFGQLKIYLYTELACRFGVTFASITVGLKRTP